MPSICIMVTEAVFYSLKVRETWYDKYECTRERWLNIRNQGCPDLPWIYWVRMTACHSLAKGQSNTFPVNWCDSIRGSQALETSAWNLFMTSRGQTEVEVWESGLEPKEAAGFQFPQAPWGGWQWVRIIFPVLGHLAPGFSGLTQSQNTSSVAVPWGQEKPVFKTVYTASGSVPGI